ncbi:hypothetical protein AX16_005956 [Volvariella volvacea WC 439]|nr:hypothetical protein AX16_005956 [Volvariella volvacea WC 439]
MTMKYLYIEKLIGYNNVQPRSNTQRIVENKEIPDKVGARVQRMEGAHLNGNEAFPLWTAAVFAGILVGLDNYTLNTTSLAYIAIRILYNQVYINHESGAVSYLRSIIFFTSVSMPMRLLFKAANKFSQENV